MPPANGIATTRSRTDASNPIATERRPGSANPSSASTARDRACTKESRMPRLPAATRSTKVAECMFSFRGERRSLPQLLAPLYGLSKIIRVRMRSAMANARPLEIRDLSKSFGGRRALDGVSLDLEAGEVLGLRGPNGAGKTTLVRTVARRVEPEGGRVRILGLAPSDVVAAAARGWVPQEIALYPLLSPRENLWTFGRYQGLSGGALSTAIASNLDWIGLADRADEKTGQLTGGMKRRLNIAAGTIHSPKVLLLDEPTVGVDPQSRERIYGMIGELRERGVSLFYTTHYMEEAERLCDRIAIIDHG